MATNTFDDWLAWATAVLQNPNGAAGVVSDAELAHLHQQVQVRTAIADAKTKEVARLTALVGAESGQAEEAIDALSQRLQQYRNQK